MLAAYDHLDVCKWLIEEMEMPVNDYGGEKVLTSLDRALNQNHEQVAAYLESKGGKRFADLDAEIPEALEPQVVERQQVPNTHETEKLLCLLM